MHLKLCTAIKTTAKCLALTCGVFVFLTTVSFAAPTPPSASPPLGVGALGKIEPHSRVVSVSHDAGPEGARIKEILVTESQEVAQGDRIAVFSDFPRKKIKLEVAKADLAVSKANVELMQKNEQFASKEYQRYRTLFQSNTVSEVKRDEAEHQWDQAKANLLIATAQVSLSEATLLSAEEELKQSELLAPLDGTILTIHARPGERVGDRGVVEMADLSKMDVVAEIYERDMPSIKEGQKAEIMIPGFSKPFHGEVTELGFQVLKNDLNNTDPLANRDNRVVEVRIALPPEDAGKLKHLVYMQVDVRVNP